MMINVYRIVMSQLSAKITKQIVITDPNRIKVFKSNHLCHVYVVHGQLLNSSSVFQIPADNLSTSFQLPSNVQLLVVYVDEPEFNWLKKEVPISAHRELFKSFKVLLMK